MSIILIVEVIVDITLVGILTMLIIEVFIFEKSLQKRGMNFITNLGNIISKNQLKEILELLERENKDYKGQVSRIIIYRHKYQYLFFYLIRLFLAHIYKQEKLINKYRKVMKRDLQGALACGGYFDKFDLIEIYEFNMKRIRKNADIDILKVHLVNAIAHEFRHRIQYDNQVNVVNEEVDAEEFAIEFCNKNKQKIKEKLNLVHTITFENIYPL